VADLSFLSLNLILLRLPIETGREAELVVGVLAFLYIAYKFSLLGDLLSLFPDCFGSLKSETEMSFRFFGGEQPGSAFLCWNFLPLTIF